MIACTIEGCHRLFKNVTSVQCHVKQKHSKFWEKYGRLQQNLEDHDNKGEGNLSGSDASSDNEQEEIPNEPEVEFDSDFI